MPLSFLQPRKILCPDRLRANRSEKIFSGLQYLPAIPLLKTARAMKKTRCQEHPGPVPSFLCPSAVRFHSKYHCCFCCTKRVSGVPTKAAAKYTSHGYCSSSFRKLSSTAPDE